MPFEVANTILAQLGGNRFLAMTGARNLVGGANALSFDLPHGFAKNKANKVRVTLTPVDEYRVEFFKLYRLDLTTVGEVDGVQAEDLRQVFTTATGLDCLL